MLTSSYQNFIYFSNFVLKHFQNQLTVHGVNFDAFKKNKRAFEALNTLLMECVTICSLQKGMGEKMKSNKMLLKMCEIDTQMSNTITAICWIEETVASEESLLLTN